MLNFRRGKRACLIQQIQNKPGNYGRVSSCLFVKYSLNSPGNNEKSPVFTKFLRPELCHHRRRQRAFDFAFGLEKICRRERCRTRLAQESRGNRRRVGRWRKLGTAARRAANAAARRYSQLHGRALGRLASVIEGLSSSFSR